MQTQIYPLKPVVTSNPLLAAQYNANPLSSFLISECLSPKVVSDLLADGAKFDTLYLVGDDGNDIVCPMGAMPKVKRIYLPSKDLENAIGAIHDAIQGDPLYGMG